MEVFALLGDRLRQDLAALRWPVAVTIDELVDLTCDEDGTRSDRFLFNSLKLAQLSQRPGSPRSTRPSGRRGRGEPGHQGDG